MLEKEGDRQSSGADASYQKEQEFGKKKSLIERGGLMLYCPASLLLCVCLCEKESFSVCVCARARACVQMSETKSEKEQERQREFILGNNAFGACKTQTFSDL